MRPFIARLARREGLSGRVLNDLEGVLVEVGGPDAALDRFEAALAAEAPFLARIDALERSLCPIPEWEGFHIERSDGRGPARAAVTIDASTCEACLAELRDPSDRRFRYPLINCTECGPRFSLITGVPYDRAMTTMAPFSMCAACAHEYASEDDRRYHAQPICCPACGPHLVHAKPCELEERLAGAAPVESEPAIEALIAVLATGGVAAIQGLGGFHLAALADDDVAVHRLRRVKRRDAKPFALMVRDRAQAERWVELGPSGAELLTSPERPIVLALSRSPRLLDRVAAPPGDPARACSVKDSGSSRLAEGVAPGTHRLGIMLPYTPIHHLLFDDPRLCHRPLVMTSANLAEAPMVHRPDELLRAFASGDATGSVDLVVLHGRAIARRVDDSIFLDPSLPPRWRRGQALEDPKPIPIRRARGRVPGEISLSPSSGRRSVDGLAVGGDLKNTFCLVRSGAAIPSAHHGDLAHLSAREAFTEEIERFLAFFEIKPGFVACDLHPDFASTRVAEGIAERSGAELHRVQHHHAHAASLLAEHQSPGPILAVVCDGFGYGPEGAAWGGELLLADLRGFHRWACLAPVPSVGGDRYASDPARPALAWLYRALGPDAVDSRAAVRVEPDERRRRQLLLLAARHATPSHSVGRLFDAAAALLGVARQNRFEAESAMALEALAASGTPSRSAPQLRYLTGSPAVLDPSDLLLWLAEHPARADAAASFHQRLAEGFAQAALSAREATGIELAGITGGVSVNPLFTATLREALEAGGLRVLTHRAVPPNDGGLSVGQAAVALASATT